MKYAVVTGASRGIGAELALLLADKGYSIAVCYHSSKEAAFQVASHVASKGRLAIPVYVDLGDPDSINKAFEYIFTIFPRIDILVNNAACDIIKPLEDTAYEEWKRIIDVNLSGVFCTSKAVVKDMRNNGGIIVNVSSIWGDIGASCETAYSASKAAVEGFTKALAKEYPTIKIIAVSPGFVDTDMNADLTEDEIAEFLRQNPEVTRKSARQCATEIIDAATSQNVHSGQIVKIW